GLEVTESFQAGDKPEVGTFNFRKDDDEFREAFNRALLDLHKPGPWPELARPSGLTAANDTYPDPATEEKVDEYCRKYSGHSRWTTSPSIWSASSRVCLRRCGPRAAVSRSPSRSRCSPASACCRRRGSCGASSGSTWRDSAAAPKSSSCSSSPWRWPSS